MNNLPSNSNTENVREAQKSVKISKQRKKELKQRMD